MNEHIDKLIQLYIDEELDSKQRGPVEMHLKECEVCSQKYQVALKLSVLLQEQEPVELKNNSEQFVSQLMLQLPAIKAEPFWNRLGKTMYVLIPAILLAAMLFIRTTTVTNIILTGADFIGLGGEAGNSLITEPLFDGFVSPLDIAGFEIFDTGSLIWNRIGSFNLFGIDIINAFVLPLLLGLLAVSWMIGWWVDQDKKQAVPLKI